MDSPHAGSRCEPGALHERSLRAFTLAVHFVSLGQGSRFRAAASGPRHAGSRSARRPTTGLRAGKIRAGNGGGRITTTSSRDWRSACASGLEEHVPAVRGKLDIAELSTPLSTRHFMNYQHGEAYGVSATPARFLFRCLTPHTARAQPLPHGPGRLHAGRDRSTDGRSADSLRRAGPKPGVSLSPARTRGGEGSVTIRDLLNGHLKRQRMREAAVHHRIDHHRVGARRRGR